MPKQSITDLRNAIESAPEMTPEHREQMLALVDSLAKEVATAAPEAGDPEDNARAENLRGAIAGTEEALRRRAELGSAQGDHDLGERLSELEEKVELVAVEHPVIANVLNAIARLI